MTRTAYSLQRRLLAMILGASTLLWLLSLAIMIGVAWDETGDIIDDALKESAHLILAATTDLDPALAASQLAPTARRIRMHYQIVADGRVIRRTEGAPLQPFVAANAKDRDKDDDDDDGFADSGDWRVYVLPGPRGDFTVQVAYRDESRLRILEEMGEDLALPALVLLAVLAGVSWYSIWRLLRPLQRASHAIAAKSATDLTPLVPENEPAELVPMTTALNSLLARLASALAAERRFTADAAHELRTPLAALRMQVQLMQRQHPEQQAPLQKLRDDIDRSTALVEQLLTLARLDHASSGRLAHEKVQLAPLLAAICESGSVNALEKAMALEWICRAEYVIGDEALLRIALHNLIANAIRYCPHGSRILVEAWPKPSTIELAVRDNGPGVPAAERERLADRFYRVLGSGVAGSGLGLSIVKRIAEQHRANLAFEDGLDGRGLTVRLSFPRAS